MADSVKVAENVNEMEDFIIEDKENVDEMEDFIFKEIEYVNEMVELIIIITYNMIRYRIALPTRKKLSSMVLLWEGISQNKYS